MDSYRLDLSSLPDWRPLECLGRACAVRPDLPVLDPADFMYAGRLVAATKAAVIHLYKHRQARSYVCLDALGHAYRVKLTGQTLTASIEKLLPHLSHGVSAVYVCSDRP
jgi:hypothetical protein